MNIDVITVIGANGTMGKNISAIFASFGNAKVYMICRSIESAKKAVQEAKMSVRSDIVETNLIPKTYVELEECVLESDLIFESVSENVETKKDVYKKFSKYIKPDTIIATSTSGLSINELSNCFSERLKPNFLGVHMYNPPYNMILCEVIPSKFTDKKLLKNIKEYLHVVLHRKVVEVLDEPAFLGNRIGFQFINNAMQYAEKYKNNGGIDYIDSILGSFTGRNIPPLVTSDLVGLDVHKAIVDNLYINTNDYAHNTFKLPEFALKLIYENKLGRKTNCGLYQTISKPDGTRVINVYDIKTEQYRPSKKYIFTFVKNMISEIKIGNYKEAFEILIKDNSLEARLCLSFLINYVIYSIVASRSVGENIHSADDIMAAGFSWIPPLALINVFGGVDMFIKIAENAMEIENIPKLELAEILNDIPISKYDYRPFLKAKE